MKIQGYQFILKVKFYRRPTKYKTNLLIADSEEQQTNFRAVIIDV